MVQASSSGTCENGKGIGILGFGRFGRLTAENLAEDFTVKTWSRSLGFRKTGIEGVASCSFEEACSQAVVIPSVPISHFREILKQMKLHLKPGTLVIDVCSVKVFPCRWMEEILPDHVSILASHPMFGPDSAANSLSGRKIFLSPLRIDSEHYNRIRSYLEKKGLTVIEGSPEDHDQQIAVTLSLPHFIGRALSRIEAKPLAIDTEGYRRLLHILEVVEHDTWQLFVDMHRYNPYAREQRLEFVSALEKIHRDLELDSGDPN